MGTLNVRMDEAFGPDLLELIRERIADIRSGAVTGYDWDQETEIEKFRHMETAVLDAQTDLDNRVACGTLAGVRHS